MPFIIDQAVLALLALRRHEENRAWKSFDWESMGRSQQKGYITGPFGKAKRCEGGLIVEFYAFMKRLPN